MATIIDGKAIADAILAEVAHNTKELISSREITPGLAFLLVGDDPASHVYVKMKGKACETCGFHSTTISLPANATEREVLDQIDRWNIDPDIHGVLVQMPLPKQIDEGKVIEAIMPSKDVDGFHPMNVGRLMAGQPCFRPCTPAGIQEMLIRSQIDPSGKHVVVVGRSNIVGKPIATILMQKQPYANAIVTVAHTGAKNIADYTRAADILIAAIGKAEAITGEMIREGAVIIDVGINRVEDATQAKGYRLVGDVHFESASAKASAISPVPGGVGKMTIAMLMRNTFLAASGAIY